METWIVERGTSLLARQLPPEAGRVLLGQVERLGLRVCLNRETECIEALGSDRLLQFNTGECLRVRLVVVAAGIRPRDELARACGLELGPRGGIRVDDHLTASDPAVYAIGECASHRGACYGLAAPGMQMADLLAGNLLGKRRAFAGCDASTRLKVPGIDVATLGDFQANGDTLRWMQGGSYRQLVVREGRLLGATVIGEWPEAGRAQELVERRARLRRGERERFVRQGRLWRGTADLSVSQWPSGALVCQCMRVPRGVLSAACAAGCLTVEQLASRTGASLVCGSCRPLLAELIGAPAESARVPGSKTLGLASLGAATLVVAILGLDSPALADSVQSQWRHWDVLWREDWAKRASGFALVSLVLVSLMFSARKRLPKFSWGAFGHWRAVHALLGVGTLGVLAAHTGFRLGHHLNLILMLNFLGLALAGSAAGAVAAWERRLGPRAGKRLRAGWTAAHIGLAWPLPALVVFHALAAYYF
jgi:nitrite reductase (NADH) large subunit